MSDLERVVAFIQSHHVMSLATCYDEELSVCSLFYIYHEATNSFVVVSDEQTRHIHHIKNNQKIAGNILLETDEVNKIKGLQFHGLFLELEDSALEELYLQRFPYAKEHPAKFWQIHVKYFKLTDNSLGFGKKIIVSDFSL